MPATNHADHPEPQPLTVVVADDHELMREGIAAVIAREPGFVVAGCAADAASAFALIKKHRPDVLLIDVFLGGSDGTHLMHELTTSHPATRILALCAFEEPTSAQRFLAAGASGFFGKSAGSEQLLEAIQTVGRGRVYSSQRIRATPSELAVACTVDDGR